MNEKRWRNVALAAIAVAVLIWFGTHPSKDVPAVDDGYDDQGCTQVWTGRGSECM